MEQQDHTQTELNTKKRTITMFGGGILIFIALMGMIYSGNQAHKQNRVTPSQRVAVVRIIDGGFQPATLSVQKGTKVVWTNEDEGLHQVASNPYPGGADLSGLKSAILNDQQSYSFIASTAGTFGYHDQMDPTVNATLIVRN
jgi:plastocyanin